MNTGIQQLSDMFIEAIEKHNSILVELHDKFPSIGLDGYIDKYDVIRAMKLKQMNLLLEDNHEKIIDKLAKVMNAKIFSD